MSATIDYSTPRPASRGFQINARMIIFAVVVLFLVGYPVYVYLDSVIHGGIKDLGGGYVEVDLKAMSNFPFDQVNGTINDIPKKWRDLDGKKVVLYGEMWDANGAGDKVSTFDLVYSISKCCMTGTPLIQHFVHSKVLPDRTASYYGNQVRVSGTLRVNVIQEAGKVQQVYALDVEDVRPAS